MRTIDGKILREMLISASNNLYNHYPEVDALNVFPVPDGDTGMNMNLTLASGSKEIENRTENDVFSIANAFSKGLLMGARGNSGVITSQIFRGFAKALQSKVNLNAVELSEALVNGSNVAYKAVMRPVEGTILTVIRESSEALNHEVDESMSIEKAMEFLIKEAHASLDRTPQLLPVLKEVGVVDSGGAGLVYILEGMNSALLGKFIEKNEGTSIGVSSNEEVNIDEFNYMVEFALRLEKSESKKVYSEDRFKQFMQTHGTSLVLVKDGDILKVHVHTQTPGAILTYAQGFGEFVTVKVENFKEKEIGNKKEEPVEEEHEPSKDFGMVSVCSGSGIEQAFKDLGVDEIVSGGQTMNPSIEDIVAAIKRTDAKTVFVFPNNSNIVMAALQAQDVLADKINVKVVTSKTIPQGITAASVFNPDADGEENYKEMMLSLKNIHSGSITYAIKDTVIDGVEVTKDYYMAIKDKKIVACHRHSTSALYDLIEQMVTEETFLITIFVGEGVKEKTIESISEKLQKKYPEVEFDIKVGGQPVYSFIVGVE